MPDLLKTGAAWLAATFKTFAAQDVVYARGDATALLRATIGGTQQDVEDGQGLMVRYESRDYLIPVIDLVLGGFAVLPEQGDRITEMDATVYEVMADSGIPAWRYSDAYRMVYRIHTKRVAAGDVDE